MKKLLDDRPRGKVLVYQYLNILPNLDPNKIYNMGEYQSVARKIKREENKRNKFIVVPEKKINLTAESVVDEDSKSIDSVINDDIGISLLDEHKACDEKITELTNKLDDLTKDFSNYDGLKSKYNDLIILYSYHSQEKDDNKEIIESLNKKYEIICNKLNSSQQIHRDLSDLFNQQKIEYKEILEENKDLHDKIKNIKGEKISNDEKAQRKNKNIKKLNDLKKQNDLINKQLIDSKMMYDDLLNLFQQQKITCEKVIKDNKELKDKISEISIVVDKTEFEIKANKLSSVYSDKYKIRKSEVLNLIPKYYFLESSSRDLSGHIKDIISRKRSDLLNIWERTIVADGLFDGILWLFKKILNDM
jgi:hypothetical protein